jgi:hypothetical protein
MQAPFSDDDPEIKESSRFERMWTLGTRWVSDVWYVRRNVKALKIELAQTERETTRLKRLLRETERRAHDLSVKNEKLSAELERMRQKAQQAAELERQISEHKRRQARSDKRRLEEHRLLQFEAAIRQQIGKSPRVFCDRALEELARALPVLFSMFYVRDKNAKGLPYVAVGSYAREITELAPQKFYLGEGVAGETARTLAPRYMALDKLPQTPTVASALARIPAQALYFLPIGNDMETLGLIELALARTLNHDEVFFAEKAAKSLGGTIEGMAARGIQEPSR